MSKRTAWLLSVLAFLLFSVALYRPYSLYRLFAGDGPVTETKKVADDSALQRLELGDSHIVVTMGHLDIVKDTAAM